MLNVGDVVVLFSGTINNPKYKWHLCVCVSEGWFLRINSRPHWRPHFLLPEAENPFLEYDCYLELRGIIEYDDSEIEEALRVPSNHKGRLSNSTLQKLIDHLPSVPTLKSAEKDLIVERVSAVLDNNSGETEAHRR